MAQKLAKELTTNAAQPSQVLNPPKNGVLPQRDPTKLAIESPTPRKTAPDIKRYFLLRYDAIAGNAEPQSSET